MIAIFLEQAILFEDGWSLITEFTGYVKNLIILSLSHENTAK